MRCKHCQTIVTHILTTIKGDRVYRCNGVNTSLQGLESSRRIGFAPCHAVYMDYKELDNKGALAYYSGGKVKAVFVRELKGR